MSRSLLNKSLIIAGIAVVMFILQSLILQLIDERASYKEQVMNDVMRNTSNAQTIIGPVLVLPYSITLKDGRLSSGYRYILPEELNIQSDDLTVKPRNINVYTAQIYQGTFHFEGQFQPINETLLKDKNRNITYHNPYITIALGDTRGINNLSEFKLDNRSYEFMAGGEHSNVKQGIHIPLKEKNLAGKNHFSFSLTLQGMNELAIVPIGKSSSFKLASHWSDPGFVGQRAILPESHDITKAGFSANWQNTWFANQINTFFEMGANEPFTQRLPAFQVTLVDTVDHYQLSTRSIKYGILFIGITFIGFLLYDLVRSLNVHPIQYGLIGGALVIFYLVLLAFSEQIGFGFAYLLASLACSLLIGFYLLSILKSMTIGGIFTGGLLATYGLLYLIIQSEGSALLFGSLFLFILLSLVMIGTRNIDWYALTSGTSGKKEEATHPWSS